MRYNLDPFDRISEDSLVEVLQDIEYYEDDILEKEIRSNGENLSVGQKQLVCIARALLRKTKIMMLDEATAAMDHKTDEVIQRTIRNKFNSYTVLTIAHRINTILDYDKIMVMDDGVVAEFGTPGELKEKGGIFASLARGH
jgi:ABC-type multidrug transport system fused ATPase/permease subunit